EGKLSPGGPPLWLSLYMILYTLAFHYIELPGFSEHRKMRIEGWIDLFWITLVIASTGMAKSPFVFLYYIVIYGNAPAAGRRSTYAHAAIAAVLVLCLSPFDGESLVFRFVTAGEWLSNLRGLLWPLTGLGIVAYFSAEAETVGAAKERTLFLEAHMDDLTGLPNMRYFTRAADLRDRLQEPYAIVMVDVDNLKQLNDAHGHAAGSALIHQVAQGLRHGARGYEDVCARLGGDEFVVRLAGASSGGALAYCKRVRLYLEENPLRFAGREFPVSLCAGIAAFPEHGRTLSEVIRRADEALYRSKRAGRNRDSIWEENGGR
ncbi:MAG: GGDEF domain-containing protein, partial [Bdellovibrionota bacterium]